MDNKSNEWPSWRYGPNGEAQVFESADEIPDGWLDHPNKFGAPAEPELAGLSGGSTDDAGAVDKNGNPWDPAVNTADKAQTSSGLWKLLPGKSRPAPVTLDL